MLSILKINLVFLGSYCFQHFSGSSVCYSLECCICTPHADFVGFFGCKSRQLPGHMLSALVVEKIRECHYIEIPAGIQFSCVPVETG